MPEYEEVSVKKPDGTFETVSLPKGMSDKDKASALKKLYQKAPFFDPQNPMMGVPPSSIPVAGFGGGIATQQTAKDVQAKAQKGEKVLRTGATVAAGTAALAGLAPLATTAGAVGTVPLIAGMGFMAGAGGAAGVVKQATEYVLGGERKSLKELGKEVTIDAVLTGLTEGGFRGGEHALKFAGDKVIMPLVARAAAATDRGKAVLDEYGTRLINGIRMVTGSKEPPVKLDLGDTLDTFKGMIAKRRTGASKAFESRWDDIESKIRASQGDVAALAEAKGEVSQFAWRGEGLNFEEKAALRWLDTQMKERIGGSMKAIAGREGKALYSAYLANRSQLDEYKIGLDLARRGIGQIAKRIGPAAIGATAGGYAGSRTGTGTVGTIGGAVAGAAALQAGAPFLLQQLIENRSAGPIVKLAINKAARGENKEAEILFKKAVVVSGIQQTLGPWLRKKLETPQEAPDAAPTR